MAAMAALSAALPPGPAPAALHRRSRRLRAGTAGSEPFGHLRRGFGHPRRRSATSGKASRAPPERVWAPPERLGHRRIRSGTSGAGSAPPRALPERPRHFSARLRGSLGSASALSGTPRLNLGSFRKALGEFRQNRKGPEGGEEEEPAALPGSGGDSGAQETAGPNPDPKALLTPLSQCSAKTRREEGFHQPPQPLFGPKKGKGEEEAARKRKRGGLSCCRRAAPAIGTRWCPSRPATPGARRRA